MEISWKRAWLLPLSQEGCKNVSVRSGIFFFFYFKKIFTGSFLHSLHSLNNIEAKESWVWIMNFSSFLELSSEIADKTSFFSFFFKLFS